jgi:hypothetical protein
MRPTNFLKALFFASILAAVFLLFRSSVAGARTTPETESMDECLQHKNEGESQKMGWESLPQQFFSSF